MMTQLPVRAVAEVTVAAVGAAGVGAVAVAGIVVATVAVKAGPQIALKKGVVRTLVPIPGVVSNPIKTGYRISSRNNLAPNTGHAKPNFSENPFITPGPNFN